METGSPSSGWLLLLAQLPSSPSSARVALWRRLRAVGATGMVSSAWALPLTPPHAEFFQQALDTARSQGGDGFVLTVSVSSPETEETIMQRFRADRGREYDELAERSAAFLAEIDKETKAAKFTFAELEESEQDLEKLARWLTKIQARDFFPDESGPQSTEMLERCRGVLEGFAWAVYAAEGGQTPAGDATAERAAGAAGDSAPTPARAPEESGGDQPPRPE